MNKDTSANGLAPVLSQIASLNAQIQQAKWDIHDHCDLAFDNGLIRAADKRMARKIVKQLAKESGMDAVEREWQRQLEESVDECRVALGYLADTPLGQAAQTSVARAPKAANGRANGVDGEARRGRGRPRGSKNKPKADAGEWSRPLQADPPATDVPDLPDAV